MDLDQVVEKSQRSLLIDDSEDIFDKDKDPEGMTLRELIDARPLEVGQSWRWEGIPQR